MRYNNYLLFMSLHRNYLLFKLKHHNKMKKKKKRFINKDMFRKNLDTLKKPSQMQEKIHNFTKVGPC